MQSGRQPIGDRLAEASNPLGKWWLHIPLAALLSARLHSRGTSRAYVPLLASAAADLASRILDRTPPHPKPPPGQRDREKPTFPSGHALETTAFTLTSAYVLAREDLLAPRAAFGAAATLIAISTAGRLYLDRHWLSDAAGGALAGLSIAAACAALYEGAESAGVATRLAR